MPGKINFSRNGSWIEKMPACIMLIKTMLSTALNVKLATEQDVVNNNFVVNVVDVLSY